MPVNLTPFYEAHRAAMEAAMQQRVELARPVLATQAPHLNVEAITHEVTLEFQIILTQLPDVGGAENRMSDFFMRLLGFLAFGRVLRRHGVPLASISEIQRETFKAHLLTVPEAERLSSGSQFLSKENQDFLREQAANSVTAAHRAAFPEDFSYQFVAPGAGDGFEFGINYTACGFCKFAARHGDQDILPSICALDFDGYATRGVRLERTQTLAGGAQHCDFRFYRLVSDQR